MLYLNPKYQRNWLVEFFGKFKLTILNNFINSKKSRGSCTQNLLYRFSSFFDHI